MNLNRYYFRLVLLKLMTFTALISEAQIQKYSISGISSGGFMAVQMGTIFSSRFSGVGTVAGGFFYCAQNHLQDKIAEGQKNFLGTRNLFLFQPSGESHLVYPAPTNPNYMSVSVCMGNPALATLPDLNQFYNEQKIEDPAQISQQKIYIYHGDLDSIVKPQMKEQLKKYYLDHSVSAEQIREKSLNGGHNFPTDKKNLNSCFHQGAPYISSCDFNLAEDMLGHLTGKNLLQGVPQRRSLYVVDQNLVPINKDRPKNQWLAPVYSVASYGYLYASDFCLQNPQRCEMHVALHGCEMNDSFDSEFDQNYSKQVAKTRVLRIPSRAEVPWYRRWRTLMMEDRKDKMGALIFALNAGYIEVAEANNMMVLFPQTQITDKNYPYNPKGCWDWYGWTGRDYASKEGQEPQWMMSYIDRISQNPQNYILSVAPEVK